MQMMYKHLPIKIIDIVDVKAKNKMSNEESLDCSQYVEKLNYLISTILQYLEKCLSESPDCEIVTSNSKMQINLMACGKTEFVEFWKTIKENII